MFKHRSGPLATLLIALGVSQAAVAAEETIDCDNATTQLELNTCAGQDYQREDDRLNALYRGLVQRLDAASQTDVRQVQRAWLRYRDLQCALESARFEEGSMQPMVQAGCMANLTRQRNEILQYMLDQANL